MYSCTKNPAVNHKLLSDPAVMKVYAEKNPMLSLKTHIFPCFAFVEKQHTYNSLLRGSTVYSG